MDNYYKSYSKRKDIEKYAYHFAHFIQKKYFKVKGNLLDIGCGAGYYMKAFKEMGYEVYGLDNDKEALKISSQFGNVRNIDLSKKFQFPFPNEFFDVVFAKSIIEHSYNPRRFIKELRRILKPEGIAYIQTPNHNTKRSQKGFYSDPTHLSPLTFKETQSLLLDFEIIEFKKYKSFPYIWRFTDMAFKINGFWIDDVFVVVKK